LAACSAGSFAQSSVSLTAQTIRSAISRARTIPGSSPASQARAASAVETSAIRAIHSTVP
jgi:hypothetical protein